MTFDIEIVLREHDHAIAEQLVHRGNDAPRWTSADVEAVLKAMLLAIDRVKNPGEPPKHVALRGFSWIVEPAEGGVVIAIEIPSGAAVAGPFKIDQRTLNQLITSVLKGTSAPRQAIH
jgi:hypothetical protein